MKAGGWLILAILAAPWVAMMLHEPEPEIELIPEEVAAATDKCLALPDGDVRFFDCLDEVEARYPGSIFPED